jgi:hypothetical protein
MQHRPRSEALVHRFSQRIPDLETADSRDGSTQPHESIPIELIRTPERVDDLGDALAGFGVTEVMGELVVLDDGAVSVLAAGRAQIHAHSYSMYYTQLQVR